MTYDRDRAHYLADHPQVVLRRGGWFATGLEWSGPWKTEQAATYALAGDYDAAHLADKAES